MVSVIVVDDDALVCASLQTILNAQPDVNVVALGSSGPEAVKLYEQHRPDVLLMDIQMPDGDGLTAGEYLLEKYPDARIAYLTTFADDEYIARALRLGAKGYLIKQNVADVIPAIHAVMAGQNVFGGEVVDHLAQGGGKGALASGYFANQGLTEREIEVVELVAQGMDNAEIAAALYMSEGTVRNHISTILQKTGLRNRTQIAVAYLRM